MKRTERKLRLTALEARLVSTPVSDAETGTPMEASVVVKDGYEISVLRAIEVTKDKRHVVTHNISASLNKNHANSRI